MNFNKTDIFESGEKCYICTAHTVIEFIQKFFNRAKDTIFLHLRVYFLVHP